MKKLLFATLVGFTMLSGASAAEDAMQQDHMQSKDKMTSSHHMKSGAMASHTAKGKAKSTKGGMMKRGDMKHDSMMKDGDMKHDDSTMKGD